MKNRLDRAALLDAVAIFLTEDLRPYVEDSELGCKVLAAANLASIAANETRNAQLYDSAQLARLQLILPDEEVTCRSPRRAISQLDTVLRKRLEEGTIQKEQLPLVWSTYDANGSGKNGPLLVPT